MAIDSANFFQAIKKHPEDFYIIHYSSQALYDEGTDGLSPRITSIVVMHYATRQTVSFALHALAESMGIPKNSVEAEYDRIEGKLLDNFFYFVRDRKEKNWIHWNMRNLTYGFEHLEHRYRSLRKIEPIGVLIEGRLNLNDILKDKYGPNFAKSPRLKNLMLLNGDLDKSFLDGQQESDAFSKKEFIRMNSSTICKVEFFRHVITLVISGKLRTEGRSFPILVDRLLEGHLARACYPNIPGRLSPLSRAHSKAVS